MQTFNSKQLAYQIASYEEDINFNHAKDITDSVFEFIAETMKKGDRKNYKYENVRVLNFGIFGVKEGRKEYYKKKDKKNGKR